MIPATDDGLLRGDGAFEVIRLYQGRPYALGDHLDRIERSAGSIELPVDRGALEHEIVDLLGEFGARDGALRIVLTRGGRRLLFCETLPEWDETIAVATVTFAPSVILTGVKSISYAANMQSTRIAASKGAEEADPRPARRRRPRGADVVDLLGLGGGRPAHPRDRYRHPRVDHPPPPLPRAPRRGGRLGDRRAPRRPRSVPRLDHPRGPGDLVDRRPRPPGGAGAADDRGARRVRARARVRARRSPSRIE